LLRPRLAWLWRWLMAASVLFAFVSSWGLVTAGPVPATAPVPGAQPRLEGLDSGLWLQVHVTGERPWPRVAVLLNGRPAAYFRTADVVVPVNPGDLIEIDGTLAPRVLVFWVTAVGDAVLAPRPGTYTATYRSIAVLGRV